MCLEAPSFLNFLLTACSLSHHSYSNWCLHISIFLFFPIDTQCLLFCLCLPFLFVSSHKNKKTPSMADNSEKGKYCSLFRSCSFRHAPSCMSPPCVRHPCLIWPPHPFLSGECFTPWLYLQGDLHASRRLSRSIACVFVGTIFLSGNMTNWNCTTVVGKSAPLLTFNQFVRLALTCFGMIWAYSTQLGSSD